MGGDPAAGRRLPERGSAATPRAGRRAGRRVPPAGLRHRGHRAPGRIGRGARGRRGAAPRPDRAGQRSGAPRLSESPEAAGGEVFTAACCGDQALNQLSS
ncbi:MAG: hypothetical protein E6J05_06700 [Chloroflexi bacterium]|nr:MAG: hypothetical protein E6J05_06700 [Chloroflexota bacterium]